MSASGGTRPAAPSGGARASHAAEPVETTRAGASSSPAWLQRAQSLAVAAAPAPESSDPAREARTSVAPVAEQLDVAAAEGLLDAWAGVLDAMDAGPVAVLKHAVPLEVGPNAIRLAFESGSFYARKVQAADVQQAIAGASERVRGWRPVVEFVLGALPVEAPTVARREEARRAEIRARRETAAKEHPMVKTFLSLVGGEIRGVKLAGE